MSRNDHFQIFHLKTCALKVNIHCDGCKHKVNKILKKIEGVYSVDIDAEQLKVIVSGNVDSTTLINKLLKSGKYAQLWPSTHQGMDTFINNDGNYHNQMPQNLITSLNAPKSQPLLTPLEDQLSFQRFLNQRMGDGELGHNSISTIENNHEHMGWDHNNVNLMEGGEHTSAFMGLQGGEGRRSFSGVYNHHQPSLPMVNNAHQQSHPAPMRMIQNMYNGFGDAMVHDNMYLGQPQIMNRAPFLFLPHTHYY